MDSKPNFLTSLLYTSYISLNSLDTTVECRGWTRDHLVSIGQSYKLSYIHMGSLSLFVSLSLSLFIYYCRAKVFMHLLDYIWKGPSIGAKFARAKLCLKNAFEVCGKTIKRLVISFVYSFMDIISSSLPLISFYIALNNVCCKANFWLHALCIYK